MSAPSAGSASFGGSSGLGGTPTGGSGATSASGGSSASGGIDSAGGTSNSTDAGEDDAATLSVTHVYATSLVSCALLSDGTARCWDVNGSGGLGDGTFTTSATPVVVQNLSNAVDIIARAAPGLSQIPPALRGGAYLGRHVTWSMSLQRTLAGPLPFGISRPTSAFVENARALYDNWSYFGFRGSVPRIDLKQRRVVIFVVDSQCPHGGPGGTAVIGLHLFSSGALVPEFFPRPNGATCEMAVMFPRRHGHAYALSLPRTLASGELNIVFEPQHRTATRAVAGPACAECAPERPKDLSPSNDPPRHTDDDRSAPLPDLGQAWRFSLPDHTPIWLLRHWDGTVSAFDASVEFLPGWPPGLRVAVRWDPLYRWVSEWFDEYGQRWSASRGGLFQYSTRVSDGRVEIGRQATEKPPTKVTPPRVAQPGEHEVRYMRAPFDDLPRQSVCDVGAAPENTWVVVNGNLRWRPEQPALVCADHVNTRGACQDRCLEVRDLQAAAE